MSIRTFNKFEVHCLDGQIVHTIDAISWLHGKNLKIFIEDKSVHKSTITRCIYGDQIDKDTIHSNAPILSIDWRSYTYSVGNKMLIHQSPYIYYNEIRTKGIFVELNDDTFILREKELVIYSIVGNKITESPYANLLLREDRNKVFSEWLNSPVWNDVHHFIETLGGHETISDKTVNGYSKLDKETIYSTVLNVLSDCKWIHAQSKLLQYSIIERYYRYTHKPYASFSDFLEEICASKELIDVYTYIGLPKHDTKCIDQLGPATIQAIKYAYIRGYVTDKTLNEAFRWKNFSMLSTYDAEFAKFFSKNIIKFGAKIVEAFEDCYIQNSCDNIKTSNLIRFSNYARKRMSKKGKCPQIDKFLLEIENGNGIAAIVALSE